MLREERSASQILFNLLPEQTIDMKGRIWKVAEWRDPFPMRVDDQAVRRHLRYALDPWTEHGRDRGAARQLWEQHSLEVVELNRERGVAVEAWPQVWVCQPCRRVSGDPSKSCDCGQRRWSQLHFVGYHSCGAVFEPYIPRCPQHGQVAVNAPGTAQAKDLRFTCPICQREMLKGLGAGRPCRQCNVKSPGTSFTVHRASSVFTSHSLTMVNPPRPDQLREIQAAGGSSRCLDWVLNGMPGQRPSDTPASEGSIVETLIAQGLPRVAAEAAAAAAASSGHSFSTSGSTDLGLSEATQNEAENEAQDLTIAVNNGRVTTEDLLRPDVPGALAQRHRSSYPTALERSKLQSVDLVDRFPVLRGVFGYSRDSGSAGGSDLVMYRGRRGAFRVYADSNETEALLVRFDPIAVAEWLRNRGHTLERGEGEREARRSILRSCSLPRRGDELREETPGSALLTLIHSYTHRLIRSASVLAGIDRDALAEYLLPRHLAAFIYAGSRGDFVLGGLQALFEGDLDQLLDAQVDGESRCPLDPGCARSSGACLACLHLGEPSCNYYNGFLDRGTLVGKAGYLTPATRPR